MVNRPALVGVARLLLLATLIIVIDIRIGSFDLINDLVGAVLVFIAVTRLRTAVPEPSQLHRRCMHLRSSQSQLRSQSRSTREASLPRSSAGRTSSGRG